MRRKRSRFENRPFYLLDSHEQVDSIFIIWKVKTLYVPFRQKIPNGRWIPMEDLAHIVPRHAFNNVCIFFENQLAVQTNPESLTRKKVRNVAWQKFKDDSVSRQTLKLMHKALKKLQYAPNREEVWLPRLEIGIIYALNPYMGTVRLQTKWEKAYSIWYPDTAKSIRYNDRNRSNGFCSSKDHWHELDMLESIRGKIEQKGEDLRQLRDEFGEENNLFQAKVITKIIPQWRLNVAALYMLNPLVMQRKRIEFLLDIWESKYYSQTKANS